MDIKSLEKLELNKVLSACAKYASLSMTKDTLLTLLPSTDLEEVRMRLNITEECDKLLYYHGVSRVATFDDVKDLLVRASKGSTLTCGELLKVNELMRSARLTYNSVLSVADDSITLVKKICNNIYFDKRLEDEITTNVLSDEQLSDYASDKLYSLRQAIKTLNERIRTKLSEYVSGSTAQYLQDGIVTIRNDRYVIPVKAEHKSKVRGLVHDRSQTGATFFIEPEQVLEMNNELISLAVDEKQEVERILKVYSAAVGNLSEQLIFDASILIEMDGYFAITEYCYKNKCVKPQVNKRGYINIIKGRHPLIDKDKVVPVSVELGKDYNFLLLSGANTGGKTVTLKMTGLFCLMAACGMFIPASDASQVAVFNDVYCDVGDSQSIEESLSTFSSHITNVIEICNLAGIDSLVLIDELGGGTNPDEGQALAKAVVEHLINMGCKGIVTTHFTPLKEFAYANEGIENASMEFDSSTLRPLYSIKIGMPGTSNALAITRRLGMRADVLDKALSYLSEGGRTFENIVRQAEDSRILAQNVLNNARQLEREWTAKINEVNEKIEQLNKQKEKIDLSARVESRKIIADRTERAEEILSEIEDIFNKEEINQSDLIKARTLKNQLNDINYEQQEQGKKITTYQPATEDNIKNGATVFVIPMQTNGTVIDFNKQKGQIEVSCNGMRLRLKLSQIQFVNDEPQKITQSVKVIRSVGVEKPMLELNVLGLSIPEALYEVDNFIDRSVMDNLEEIKVIHGFGMGKLKKAIANHLKLHKNVKEFRPGKYGEGEHGVTIIKLK